MLFLPSIMDKGKCDEGVGECLRGYPLLRKGLHQLNINFFEKSNFLC